MYDHELILLDYTTTKDDIGNQELESIETKILCKIKDISSSEFYNAKIAGLKPEKTFIVHSFEYTGQTEVKFQGQKYKVERTYIDRDDTGKRNSLAFEEIELICSKAAD